MIYFKIVIQILVADELAPMWSAVPILATKRGSRLPHSFFVCITHASMISGTAAFARWG